MVDEAEKNGAGPHDRDAKGRFLPGNKQATNGGRTKLEFTFQAVIDRCLTCDDWEAVVRSVYAAALGGDMRAAQLLIEHRFGKPKETVALTGAEGKPLAILVQSLIPRPHDDPHDSA